MARTLHEALAAIFQNEPLGPPATVMTTSSAAPVAAGAGAPDAARQALAHYEAAIAKLKAGDWSGFGAELDALRPLLESLSHGGAGH
jgi:uncharacterized protein